MNPRKIKLTKHNHHQQLKTTTKTKTLVTEQQNNSKSTSNKQPTTPTNQANKTYSNCTQSQQSVKQTYTPKPAKQ